MVGTPCVHSSITAGAVSLASTSRPPTNQTTNYRSQPRTVPSRPTSTLPLHPASSSITAAAVSAASTNRPPTNQSTNSPYRPEPSPPAGAAPTRCVQQQHPRPRQLLVLRRNVAGDLGGNARGRERTGDDEVRIAGRSACLRRHVAGDLGAWGGPGRAGEEARGAEAIYTGQKGFRQGGGEVTVRGALCKHAREHGSRGFREQDIDAGYGWT